MALEDKIDSHVAVVDKFIDPTSSTQLTVRDYVVRPSATTPITLTLPPVNEAKGRFYSFVARAVSGGASITITDADDSECWLGDIVLDSKCDRALLYSDGLTWHALGAAGPGQWPGFETTSAPATAAPQS